MKIVFSQKIQQRSGSILLLSLLIMSLMMTVSVATSTLILQGIAENRYLNYGTVAGYAAETGLEESLYSVRKQSVPLDFLVSTSTLSNNAQFYVQASSSEAYVLTSLNQDQTLPLTLGNFQDLTQSQPINYLCFHWIKDPNSKLVVNWTAWDQDGQVYQSCNSGEITHPADFPVGGGGDVQWQPYWQCQLLGTFSPASGQCTQASNVPLSYKVELKALDTSINSLMIIAFNGPPVINNINGLNNPNQESIPNRLHLTATAVYPFQASDASNQSLSVSGPLNESNASLYDFVLFSQETISK